MIRPLPIFVVCCLMVLVTTQDVATTANAGGHGVTNPDCPAGTGGRNCRPCRFGTYSLAGACVRCACRRRAPTCRTLGGCFPNNGTCIYPAEVDGTGCLPSKPWLYFNPRGTCQGGTCVLPP